MTLGMRDISNSHKPPKFQHGDKVPYGRVGYTVASYDPATETYTINSLEKVGQIKLEGVLRQTVADKRQTVAENAEPLPSETYYGKQVRYKDVAYTVASFDKGTRTYTISSVVKVSKDKLEGKEMEELKRAGGQGRSGTFKAL